MLSKEAFNKGIEQLVIEFECKGFKISKGKATLWYEHMKYMSDKEFNQRIEYVLKNSSFIPSMADIFKAENQGVTIEERRRAKF